MIALDDNIEDHPKFVSLSTDACWLWVCCIGYCRRQRTDGYIPEAVARRSCRGKNPNKVIAELTSPPVGAPEMKPLWEKVLGGYQVHDYLQWNPSKADVEAKLEQKREAGKAGGKQSGVARSASSQPKREAKQERSEPEAQCFGSASPSASPMANSDPYPDPDPVPDQDPPCVPPSGDDPPETPPAETPRAPPSPPVDAPPPTKRKRATTKTRCPPSDDPGVAEWLVAERVPALSSSNGAEVAKFLDHHHSRSTLFGSWVAAWRNWDARADQYGSRRTGPAKGHEPPKAPYVEPPPPPSPYEGATATPEEIAETRRMLFGGDA